VEEQASSASGWVGSKATDFINLWKADPLFGPNPPELPLWGAGRKNMPNKVNEFIDITNDPWIATGILVGLGIPGYGEIGSETAICETEESLNIAESSVSKWDKATFNDESASLEYHWRKHGEPFGKSKNQYSQDAINFFEKNKSKSIEIELQDGRTGLKIPGKPGGIYTKDGKVISFWYE
jgi:hypothetical protein